MLLRRSFFLLLLFSSILPLQSQTDSNPSGITFKSQTRIVLVDVVVTDKNNHPVTGLTQDIFQVFEQGKAQAIASFEEHGGAPDTSIASAARPPLPTHVYTNEAVEKSTASINVILLDSLNTPLKDQSYVHDQVVSFLHTIQPGPRFAIVTLSTRLRLVQGFTGDQQVLMAALNEKKRGAGPQTSMLGTQAEDNMNKQLLAEIANNHGSGAAVGGLAAFLAEMSATQQTTRLGITLQALQQLSTYLAGFPGRKNLIWFSSSFPAITFPKSTGPLDVNPEDSQAEYTRKTVNALASAQIAVYPIAAQSLEASSYTEASRLPDPKIDAANPGQSSINELKQQLKQDSEERFFKYDAMNQIAKNTGGEAFYNRNDLNVALADAVHKGADYYQISYSPSNKETDGRYRHVEIRLRGGPYTLAYRQGYYAETAKEAEKIAKAEQSNSEADPLQPAMQRGLPDSSQIPYKMRVVTSTPASSASPAGDNKDLHGPVTHIGADFIIPLDNLQFEKTPDGVLHGNVELALVAYDRDGGSLNWLFRSIKTSLKPELHDAVEKAGVRFHQDIDVPQGEVFLRTGIYDLESHKLGTLEIPLSQLDLSDSYSASAQSSSSLSSNSPVSAGASAPDATHAVAPSSPDTTNNPWANLPIANSTLLSLAPSIAQQNAPLPEPAPEVIVNVPAYCSALPGGEQSSALANVCEFVLLLHRKLPNVICDREMKRYWKEVNSSPGARGGMMTNVLDHADTVTAKVTYKDGQEYYNDIRVDGVPSSASAPELSGTWSNGEFATILDGVFSPLSKAEFHLENGKSANSAKVLVFRYTVAAQNNKSYFLRSTGKTWFPEYQGRLWIDRQSSKLLRLERETAYMPQEPIVRMKTVIEYASVVLGDSSNLILPEHSDILICSSPINGNSDNCARSIVKFTHWHKFGATSNIVPVQ